MLTMLLGGLWHGASWNFIIWGGYHGSLLAIERAIRGERRNVERWSWLYPVQWLLTLTLVMVSWVFFRAADLHQSMAIIGQMFSAPHGRTLLTKWQVGLIVGSWALAMAEEKLDWFERLMRAPVWAYASALALMMFCLEVFGVIDARIPFIYFQF
jgi:D-alanyl-lipoteichoic acid acyltransferase DltB (MBOAT superfamily)